MAGFDPKRNSLTVRRSFPRETLDRPEMVEAELHLLLTEMGQGVWNFLLSADRPLIVTVLPDLKIHDDGSLGHAETATVFLDPAPWFHPLGLSHIGKMASLRGTENPSDIELTRCPFCGVDNLEVKGRKYPVPVSLVQYTGLIVAKQSKTTGRPITDSKGGTGHGPGSRR